ncbi:MAG: transcriptional regulator, partial [Acidobacteriota bacterium]
MRPEEGWLRRGTEEVRLRHLAMRTLELLVSHPGRLVTKEEFFEEVWGGGAVEDGALARCISEIRSVLGDDPREPRYIETLPKRGYRLVARVRSGSAPEGALSSPPVQGAASESVESSSAADAMDPGAGRRPRRPCVRLRPRAAPPEARVDSIRDFHVGSHPHLRF